MKRMKIVLPGGSGHLGQILRRTLTLQGHEVVILSRDGAAHPQTVAWDGRTVDDWACELDGADAVINLAGRSVNCRYTKSNVRAMFDSRIDSTRAVGQAIEQAHHPPRLWLQMSTATIYAHRFDAPNDDLTGRIGGNEPEVPGYWRTSIDIAKAWEAALAEASTPATRKVALRTAMVMSPHPGGVLDVLGRLARFGLGGPIAGGRQFVSWIHERDFVSAVEFVMERDEIEGAINLAAPCPLPQREFMRELRSALDIPIGLPATRWMVEIGALVLRTDTELVLKSRRVVPRRLLDAGFSFQFPEWPQAADELVQRLGRRETQ